jgi:hypothetical protein
MRTIHTRSVVVRLAVSTLVIGFAAGAIVAWSVAADEPRDARLKGLLHEKLKILKHVVSLREEMYKNGMAGPKELYDAHVALQRAKLEVCEADTDRIAVLEVLLSEAKRRESMEMSLLKEAGRAAQNGPLQLMAEAAHVERLNIEIEIERIRLK